jgi:catechol-2,3-dioxygenase
MSSESNVANDGTRSVSPKKLSHAVLRTCHFKEMVEWYKTVLSAEIMNQNDFIAFMTYDDEHHRIAIATIPGMVERPKHSAGLDHLSFTYGTLGDLVATYERLKAAGITPFV